MDRDALRSPTELQPFWRFFSVTRTRAAGEPGGSIKPGQRKVLIVEDNQLLSMQLEDALSEAGFHVVGKAATADQAVALARSERPELMVMDIRLEGSRDGIAAATEIYAELGIRSIFASAFSASDLRDRSAAAKPLGWINKPYDVDALVNLVRDALPAKPQN
jgi:DNA-binding NarL/FixJ family response regulator